MGHDFAEGPIATRYLVILVYMDDDKIPRGEYYFGVICRVELRLRN